MHVNLITGLVIILIAINSSSSTCICADNAGYSRCSTLELRDVDIRSNKKEPVTTIDTGETNSLPINALSFQNVWMLSMQCDIHILNTNSFANQATLKDLDLSENSISTIPNDFFVNVPLLNKLNLSRNSFQSPTLDTFYSVNNITILDISHNEITTLQLGVLDEMKKLKKLYLKGNKITDLPLGLFDKSKALLVLDISDNELHEIVLGLFDTTKQLKEINVAGNKFEGEIPLGTYDGFTNVNTLNISNSQIESFPLGVFDETIKVMTLDISTNTIYTLPLGILDEMKLLTKLYLQDCKLKEIPAKLFDRNTALETLNLSHNNLKTLPDGLFNLTQEMKYLNLSYNLIYDLPLKLFQYTSLVEIDISHNKFVTIKPELLNMETLEKVHAQNNRISFLATDTFATNGFPLIHLDVSNNRLVFIEEEYFFEWTENLQRMEILGNPWDCTCFNDLLVSLSKRAIKYTTFEYFHGTKPICVDKGLSKCDVKMDNRAIQLYYNIFVGH